MTMRIYVGTYAKYNSGNLFGAWLDLEDYSDKEEFYGACKELHSDEEDAEFMFQDWEDIPSALVSESFIAEEVFEMAAMSDNDREILEAYQANFCEPVSLDDALENHRGEYRSGAEFAEEYAVETGMIDEDSPMFGYIDWERYWNADMRHEFFESNGHYFINR